MILGEIENEVLDVVENEFLSKVAVFDKVVVLVRMSLGFLMKLWSWVRLSLRFG